jgi:hypothetical protein
MDAEKGQARRGNALRCLGGRIERTTKVDEPCLESVVADSLDLLEHLEKRIRLLGIDRPGVRLCSEFDLGLFPSGFRPYTKGREGTQRESRKGLDEFTSTFHERSYAWRAQSNHSNNKFSPGTKMAATALPRPNYPALFDHVDEWNALPVRRHHA